MILEFFLAGCVVGFSLLLFITSLLSYTRLRHLRFAYISVAFLLFLIKGILSLTGVAVEELKSTLAVPYQLLFLDLLILLLLYLAVAKR